MWHSNAEYHSALVVAAVTIFCTIGLASCLVALEAGAEAVWVFFQRLHESNYVLKSQPGTRSDRVMRRVKRVSKKHHVAERPAIIPQLRKVTPTRLVRYQRMTA